MKFGRRYRLTIQKFPDTLITDTITGQTTTAQLGEDNAIIIEPPITIQFSIQRTSMASLNSMNLVIYNLSDATRRDIFQDRFNFLTFRRIILEAGYGNDLSVIFSGNVYEANSARQGSNIITTINSRDGGFDTANSRTFTTVAGGTPIRGLIETLFGGFPNLNQGVIGDVPGTVKRPAVLDGNTMRLLSTYSNNQVFIDNETVNLLNDNEYIERGDIPVFDADNGLLETPRRDDAYLTITTLLEPNIIMGQLVEIRSSILPIYNGQYKVIGVNHQGIISEAVGGACQSTFNLLLDGQLFGKFNPVGNIA